MWRGSLASPVLPVVPSISHCPLGRPVGLRGAGARWEEFFWEEFPGSFTLLALGHPQDIQGRRGRAVRLPARLPRGRRRVVRDQVDRAVQPAVDGGGQPWGQGTGLGGRVAQGRLAGRRDRRKDQSTDGVVTDGWYFRSFVFQSNVSHTRQERGRGYITRVTQSLAPATFAALAVHALKFETSKSSCPREEDPAATTMRGTITKGQICPTWYGSTTPPT
jgi:hypothetical protein